MIYKINMEKKIIITYRSEFDYFLRGDILVLTKAQGRGNNENNK